MVMKVEQCIKTVFSRCCVLLLALLATPALAEVLEQVAGWRLLNFGNGDPRDSVATGVVVTGDKIFISMPRARYADITDTIQGQFSPENGRVLGRTLR